MLSIAIDDRESDTFQSNFKQHFPNIIIKRLEIGDIHIYNNDQLIIVIERKEINDLASSLHDSRYHEQKIRLKQLKNCRIIYLIEGNINDIKFSKHLNEDVLKGIVINTTIRDNIHIFRTNNLHETIQYIKDILHRLPKYVNELFIDTNNSESYASCISINKKNNNTPIVCYINQLKNIPGISNNIASEISKLYPNFVDLIIAFQDKGKDCISDLKVNNRRIGSTISNRLYDYLGIKNE